MARTINNNFCNADGTTPQYLPGQEPDQIKKRLATLFAKLDDAYPDYVISAILGDVLFGISYGSRIVLYPRTNIKRIAVASANLHFIADDVAFYRIRENGAKELLYRFPKTDVKENVKKDVQGIFSGYEFCVADDNQGSDIKALITRNGGCVVAEMGEMTDFLIVSTINRAAEEKAKKRKVRIMPEEVLRSLCKVS